MNEVIKKEEIIVEDLIYEVRGQQVMLDSDLATIYEVETKYLNRQVKRNIERFDSDFMFQLTEDEYKNLKCQIVTSSLNSYGGRRTLPYVFTELGVATLASMLRSEIAISMSKKIIRAFVTMRHYFSSNLIEQKHINNLVYKHDEDIKLLQTSFNKLQEKTENNAIFFEGQIYDAYSVLLDILNKAKEEIIIMDNYAGKELLDILKDINVKIKIYSKNMNETLIEKYQKEYDNVELIYNDKFHDRFIILDNRVLYHCGSSFKDLGKKCFAINKVDNNKFLNSILENVI